jgi:short-subunit dehydrogenase
MRISGSKVLLTGASGGIGQAIARSLSGLGASLVLTGRRPDVLDPLAKEFDARTLVVDLAVPSEVDRLVGEAGEVDILVANAALPASGPLESFSVEQIDRALNVNLRAPIILTHGLVPQMVARGGGHLLFMSSLAGKAATAGSSLYNASKFGLRGFAAAVRADLRSANVGVSAVFPGFIRDAGMFADAGATLPPGIGTRSPEDVAAAVVDAIENNRGEVDVAPLTVRMSATFAGIAPELAANLARRMGGDDVARQMHAGQADKR